MSSGFVRTALAPRMLTRPSATAADRAMGGCRRDPPPSLANRGPTSYGEAAPSPARRGRGLNSAGTRGTRTRDSGLGTRDSGLGTSASATGLGIGDGDWHWALGTGGHWAHWALEAGSQKLPSLPPSADVSRKLKLEAGSGRCRDVAVSTRLREADDTHRAVAPSVPTGGSSASSRSTWSRAGSRRRERTPRRPPNAGTGSRSVQRRLNRVGSGLFAGTTPPDEAVRELESACRGS